MNLIKRHRASAIGGFVCAGIFFALIITLFVVTKLYEEEPAMIAGISAIFCVPLLLLVGLSTRELLIIRDLRRTLSDPSSLPYATYGEGNNGKYFYFSSMLDKAAQTAANVAGNVVGILSFAVGGVGVFGFSIQYTDVFVATDEIVLNTPAKNPKLRDEKFRRIPASEIERATYERNGKKVTVNLFLSSGQKLNMTANLQNEEQSNTLCEKLNTLKTREREMTGGRDPFAGFAPSSL